MAISFVLICVHVCVHLHSGGITILLDGVLVNLVFLIKLGEGQDTLQQTMCLLAVH